MIPRIRRGKEISTDANDECWDSVVDVRNVPELFTFHNENGPAQHYIGDDGTIHETWYVTERGRHLLHRLDGPCYTLNGVGKYWQFWGQSIPKEWTMPGGLTVEAILAVENQEQRRVGVRAFGPAAFARATHKKTLDYRPHIEAPDALVELVDGSRWLVGTDGSSGRDPYYLRVPAETETCEQAQLALYGTPEPAERT